MVTPTPPRAIAEVPERAFRHSQIRKTQEKILFLEMAF
jgi:hypothetical protein